MYFYKFSVFRDGDHSYFGFLDFNNAQLSRLTLFNDFSEGQLDVHFDTVCSPEDDNSMFLRNGRVNLRKHIPPKPRRLLTDQTLFDVEYIYGFVWWGVCKQSRWRHSVTEPSKDSGYMLLWQRYENNMMVAMRYYGNVMTTTMSQYSDDVSSVTHAGCICAPVNAITTCSTSSTY